MINRDFNVQRRRSASGPVLLQAGAADETAEYIREFVVMAMRMLAEDEQRRTGADTTVPFGAWLSDPGARRIIGAVARIVEAMSRMRLDDGLTPVVFETISSLAAHVGADRTHVLDPISPRAQLLPAIVSAAFAVDGLLGPVAAHVIYHHAGKAGRGASVFGVHKEPGAAAISRVIGLASVGPDTSVPITGHALIPLTRDDPSAQPADPDRIVAGSVAMEKCGLRLPQTLAEHIDQSLEILAAAREVVFAATKIGSPACSAVRLDPSHMLREGFSRWLLLGRVEIGPSTVRGRPAAGLPVALGLEAGVLRAAATRRMRPLALAADSGTSPDPDRAGIVYDADDHSMAGVPLIRALLTGDRSLVPGLRELGPVERRLAEENAARNGIACTVDSKYLVLDRGVRLTGDGAAVPVAVLVRVSLSRTIIWTTTLDLSDADLAAAAVARAELHVRTMESTALQGGVAQFFKDHAVHQLQAATYRQHLATRIVMILANLAAVGVARRRETGRGPT